ncbi:hypothetical protein M099_0946 [Phocaeicola vulgatus str. 3975 RP4]|uniref:Uncharacterized protein n=1 Tax=Phocaeicola vulgatus str. 3975 RP4 TaxID=1339352 RepID=A0A069SL43_PHOVU|nr:hypothetical protein M099_0946 [Phocaeicola vulgatus str. 3975 RP4]
MEQLVSSIWNNLFHSEELFIPTGQNHLFRPYGTSYSTAESHLFLMVEHTIPQ